MQCHDPLPPEPSNLAGWLLFAIPVAIVVIDVALYLLGRETMSQWFKRKIGRRFRWWKPFAVGVVVIAMVHLLLGGPI
jgi:hypothetical protein